MAILQLSSWKNKSVWLINKSDGAQWFSFKGKFPTNLKLHLQKKHSSDYKEFEESEKKGHEKANENLGSFPKVDRTYKISQAGQLKLPEVISGGTMYDQNSEQYKLITKELAILIGATDIPLYFVEHNRFKRFVQALNRCYKAPSRTKVSSEINKFLVDMKMAISSYISKTQSINLCTDIWTKKVMTAAFLGTTAHFFPIRITSVTM